MDIREAKNRLEHLRRIGELERIRTEQRELEERYNPYHDPRNGRFTNANGGGMGGMFVVPKGGKGFYAQLNKGFSDEDIDDMYQAEMAKNRLSIDKAAMPALQGVSEKQIKFGEDKRDMVINEYNKIAGAYEKAVNDPNRTGLRPALEGLRNSMLFNGDQSIFKAEQKSFAETGRRGKDQSMIML